MQPQLVFGVGNSSFHFEDFEGFTDSVYLGAWKRKIFEKTGLFDTTFKRNQDDEFHYRAKSMGFKVYQDPEIKLVLSSPKNICNYYLNNTTNTACINHWY